MPRPRIIFVTGAAASGKSTAVKVAEAYFKEKGITHRLFSDEEEMFKLISADTGNDHHYFPPGKKHFLFKDSFVFDEGLKRINSAILNEISSPTVNAILVEIARGGRSEHVDVTFNRALELLDQKITDRATFVFIQSSFKDRIKRNANRGDGQKEHTPAEVMRSIYIDVDIENLKEKSDSVMVIENNGTKNELELTMRQKLGGLF